MRQVGLVGGSWMERRDADSTGATLLAGPRDDPRNPAVWREFDRSYRPLVSARLGTHLPGQTLRTPFDL